MIGERIKSVRISKGVTQKHVAESAGISQMALYRIEKGESKVDAVVLNSIANVLSEDIRIFFDDELTESVTEKMPSRVTKPDQV